MSTQTFLQSYIAHPFLFLYFFKILMVYNKHKVITVSADRKWDEMFYRKPSVNQISVKKKKSDLGLGFLTLLKVILLLFALQLRFSLTSCLVEPWWQCHEVRVNIPYSSKKQTGVLIILHSIQNKKSLGCTFYTLIVNWIRKL